MGLNFANCWARSGAITSLDEADWEADDLGADIVHAAPTTIKHERIREKIGDRRTAPRKKCRVEPTWTVCFL